MTEDAKKKTAPDDDPLAAYDAAVAEARKPQPPKHTVDNLGLKLADEAPEASPDYAGAYVAKNGPEPPRKYVESKNDRSRRILSAVSDGLSALGNVWTTSKGAQNIEGHGLRSAAAQARYARLKAEAEQDWQKWRSGYDKALALDIAFGKEARDRQAKAALANNNIRLKLGELNALADYRDAALGNKAATAGLNARTRLAVAEISRISRENAAHISASRPRGGRGGGGSSNKTYTISAIDGPLTFTADQWNDGNLEAILDVVPDEYKEPFMRTAKGDPRVWSTRDRQACIGVAVANDPEVAAQARRILRSNNMNAAASASSGTTPADAGRAKPADAPRKSYDKLRGLWGK